MGLFGNMFNQNEVKTEPKQNIQLNVSKVPSITNIK